MSSPLLTPLIDRACGPLTERLEHDRLPSLMRVHPDVFACIRDMRERELTDGYPLIFLGMELAAGESLPLDGFEFVD